MKVGITVNTGNFESIRFDSDDLLAEEAYLQLKERLEEWVRSIPRCSWWITEINKILAPPVPIVKTLVKSPHLSAQPQPTAPLDATDRYNYLDKNGEPNLCNKCNDLISWDKYPDVKHPIHVDKEGKAIGDGSCPNFD